ncbi:MAG: hypothetical protein NT142_15255 [Planctomycetota bacterium]|nr:hypothetical protein [Planctomycetota bacterium]
MSHNNDFVEPSHEGPTDRALLKKISFLLISVFLFGIGLYGWIAWETTLTGHWSGF